MPLYSVRRVVGAITQDDLDAAAYRSIVCAFQFDGLKWHQSYLDRASGELTCIYDARSASQIEDHARQSRIPCDGVREVVEVRPEPYIHG